MKEQPGFVSSVNSEYRYEIRIRGHLGTHWSEWFGGVELFHEDEGNTVLFGPFIDQAALHSVLRKVRDSGMILYSVQIVEEE